jgi:hypothetical protein
MSILFSWDVYIVFYYISYGLWQAPCKLFLLLQYCTMQWKWILKSVCCIILVYIMLIRFLFGSSIKVKISHFSYTVKSFSDFSPYYIVGGDLTAEIVFFEHDTIDTFINIILLQFSSEFMSLLWTTSPVNLAVRLFIHIT